MAEQDSHGLPPFIVMMSLLPFPLAVPFIIPLMPVAETDTPPAPTTIPFGELLIIPEFGFV